MKVFLIAYLGVAGCYLILDGIWLGLVAKNSYLEAMQGMLRESYPVLPWVTFYILYSAAAVYLVVLKNLHSPGWQVFFDGAILGLAAYGAYNLTNYAILEGWPLGITLKDWAWGTFVTAASCWSGWWLVSNLYQDAA
ncbi:DUF2177 family protein [Aliiglaciecola lipolytica]|uniref:Transmembrane protein n=1 Tax=Aliiglaciecola lipolytica E3 TaxID=1127673 RepID=K6YZT7_9ALTE|nr:DUF2177 family protein [Aliiglaciecola lipolytica]GAC16725.1 hypothetical protein GLIP_4114 [Aliiglaciecola lipolytica E3]